MFECLNISPLHVLNVSMQAPYTPHGNIVRFPRSGQSFAIVDLLIPPFYGAITLEYPRRDRHLYTALVSRSLCDWPNILMKMVKLHRSTLK